MRSPFHVVKLPAAMQQPPAITRYSAGLLFSLDGDRVALVRKKKPAWQAGKLNAIGGKIEPGESPHDCMVREFLEEAGVYFTCWSPLAVLTGADFECHFFTARSRLVDHATTMEEEEIVVVPRLWALSDPTLIPNLRVLIPLALDESGIAKPVQLRDAPRAA